MRNVLQESVRPALSVGQRIQMEENWLLSGGVPAVWRRRRPRRLVYGMALFFLRCVCNGCTRSANSCSTHRIQF